nr:hypothetical protein [Tanacetum cinerariifolium]
MSRDVLIIGSTMRIPLLYRGEYSQWVERFMDYLEEQTDGKAMINSIKNGDQPLPRVTQVSIAGTSSTKQPLLKDKTMWKAAVLYEYKTFKATEGELLLDTYIRYLQWKQYATMMRQNKNFMDINIDALYYILKQNQRDVNDAMGSKKKTIVVTSDPLALIAEKTKVSKSKEKVVVSLDSEGSDADDFSKLKKITALLAKAFNRRKFYSKPTNNNLRTSSTSQSANKKQEFVKNDNNKDDEKKRDMSRVKCYNCKKEGHFAKDCKKVKVKDYEYYKTKMLLAKKDKDELVLLAEDQAWMESRSDSDQEINANMVFMAQIEKVLLDSEASSSSADEKISEEKYAKIEAERYEKRIGFENPSYFEKAKYFRPTLYDEKVIGLGYTPMFLTHSDEALEIEKFKRSRENKIEFAYDYGNLNAIYVNEKINFEDDYFQDIINPYFEKIDSPFQQTCSLKPYVPNVILEKIIIYLEDEVICLWIIDSGCSKHMTGNRALLTNFVEKFLGTVRFGNNDFAVIAGYGDVGLEVAFRKSTCFVRNEYGVDLLTGDRSSNLYTIALNEVASNSLTCLLVKASSLQSWLWHQRLSHLNFAIISNLVKNNLVQGILKTITFKQTPVSNPWLEVDDKQFDYKDYWTRVGKPTLTNHKEVLVKEPLMRIVHKVIVGSLVHRVASRERCQKSVQRIDCEYWTSKMLADELEVENTCLEKETKMPTQAEEGIRKPKKDHGGLNST